MTLAQIQVRRGTAAEWTAANPVLLSGEPGLETDTNKWKWGNGSDAWVDLDYNAVPGGGGGGGSGPFLLPEDYGAVGDGVADDTTALQACFDDAEARDGATVYLAGVYRITGPVTVKNYTSVIGPGSSSVATEDSAGRILCDSATARLNWGKWVGGQDRPALAQNFVVDGNGTGDPTGIVHLECEDTTWEGVVVKNAGTHGMYFNHIQNCTFINLRSGEHLNGTACIFDLGCGGSEFLGGHIYSSKDAIDFKADSGAPAGQTLNYQLTFDHVVIESYLTGITTHQIRLRGASINIRFVACGIVMNATQPGPLVIVESGPLVPEIEFNSCWWVGRSAGTTHGVDITGTQPAIVAITGYNNIDLNGASAVRTATAQATVYIAPLQRYVAGTQKATTTGAGSLANFYMPEKMVITRYTTAQTDTAYDVPFGAQTLLIKCVGGGGGGGSGRRGAAASVRCGGGAGGGGGSAMFEVRAADVGDTLYVTVGAGGTGGAAIAADSTNGANGTAGGVSYVATDTTPTVADLVVSAFGGGAGLGGTAAAGTGGAQGAGAFFGGSGGSASAAGGAGASPTVAGQGGAGQGGGSGGGISAADVASSGGNGLPPYGRWNTISAPGGAIGNAGTAGTAPVSVLSVGSSGGGGGSSITGAAGAGGAGGRGSGGGGGGASLNGNLSGAGGNGGIGYVEITAIF